MSEKLRESLSATIDDEADEFELRRVLDEMDKDESLRETWERYHLIGTLMRGLRRDGEFRDIDLRDKVWAALETEDPTSPVEIAEPDVAVPSKASGRRPWVGRMTGLAVAASVAFAVVLGIGGLDQDDAAVTPPIAKAPVNIDGPRLHENRLKQEVSASDLQRANAYFVHHVQQKALNQPGVASFVKLVTYEQQ
jgi:sigma-E factor negative regulatory protein RseA